MYQLGQLYRDQHWFNLLDLTGSRFSVRGLQVFVESLQGVRFRPLKIDLTRTEITSDHLQVLSPLFPLFDTVRLGGNALNEDAVRFLLHAMQQPRVRISVLHLENCGLSDVLLAQVIAELPPTVHKLFVNNSPRYATPNVYGEAAHHNLSQNMRERPFVAVGLLRLLRGDQAKFQQVLAAISRSQVCTVSFSDDELDRFLSLDQVGEVSDALVAAMRGNPNLIALSTASYVEENILARAQRYRQLKMLADFLKDDFINKAVLLQMIIDGRLAQIREFVSACIEGNDGGNPYSMTADQLARIKTDAMRQAIAHEDFALFPALFLASSDFTMPFIAKIDEKIAWVQGAEVPIPKSEIHERIVMQIEDEISSIHGLESLVDKAPDAIVLYLQRFRRTLESLQQDALKKPAAVDAVIAVADVLQVNRQRRDDFFAVIESGDEGRLEAAIAAGNFHVFHTTDTQHFTALHIAVSTSPQMLRLLLESPIFTQILNQRSSSSSGSNTPLHLAIIKEEHQIANDLAQAIMRADMPQDIANASGQSPLDLLRFKYKQAHRQADVEKYRQWFAIACILNPEEKSLGPITESDASAHARNPDEVPDARDLKHFPLLS